MIFSNLRRKFGLVQRSTSRFLQGILRAVFFKTYSESRAEKLLFENLTAEQQAQYLKTGSFKVRGGITGHTYLIARGRVMNIYRLGGRGEILEQLCFHTTNFVPIADNMLAQKIMLESGEVEALAIANKRPVRSEGSYYWRAM